MLCRALAKLVMRAAGYQAKTTCGNLQMCVGLKASIEGETQTMGQRRLQRMRRKMSEEEAGSTEGEEGSENVEVILNSSTIETGGTEEEATEGLEDALEMEVDGYGEYEGVGEGKEEGGGNI